MQAEKAGKKGITPIIATIILLFATIAIIGTAFLFMNRSENSILISVENESEAFTSNVAHFSIDGVGNNGIYIRNLEGRPIKNQSITVYINDKKVDVDPLDIGANTVGSITLSDGIMPAGVYKVKVMARLSQDAYTYTIPLANNLQEPSFNSVQRKPLDIALVIDRSPSMNSGNKLASAKAAAKLFVDLTLTADKITVVSFADTATVQIPLTEDHAAAKSAIDAIVISGSGTAIGIGIDAATTEIKKDPSGRDGVQILLTDGKENKGSDPVGKAQLAAQDGIAIYTIGLGSGTDIDEPQLQQIADIAGGKYYHAPTAADLNAIYTDISTQLGTSWKRYGSTEINIFGSACNSPPICSLFNSGVYSDTYVFQDVRFLFSGKYNVVTASAYVNPSGQLCDNECSKLPGERCRQNDARLHLIALDGSGNKLDEFKDYWAGTLGTGWVNVKKTWLTPQDTKILRFQIDAGSCCSSCSASGIYIDDAELMISNT